MKLTVHTEGYEETYSDVLEFKLDRQARFCEITCKDGSGAIYPFEAFTLIRKEPDDHVE